MSGIPIRVIIDTNVFIRYLLRPGVAIRCLVEDLWLGDRILVVSAPELLQELNGVLNREAIRAYIDSEAGQSLLEAIQIKAEIYPTLDAIPAYSRDPKDDKFIACAIIRQASFVISEDRDLLALGEVNGIHILTPYDFLRSWIGNYP